MLNLYTEHIMRNAGLDELLPGINIGRRNINNLRYAYDITLMAEGEEDPSGKARPQHSRLSAGG